MAEAASQVAERSAALRPPGGWGPHGTARHGPGAAGPCWQQRDAGVRSCRAPCTAPRPAPHPRSTPRSKRELPRVSALTLFQATDCARSPLSAGSPVGSGICLRCAVQQKYSLQDLPRGSQVRRSASPRTPTPSRWSGAGGVRCCGVLELGWGQPTAAVSKEQQPAKAGGLRFTSRVLRRLLGWDAKNWI